jgi:prepilin signal peptidase PulO-like enzyme (type II secretory pathway)
VNWILAVPIELRLAVAFAVGTCLGAMANWAAVRFAWEPRATTSWIRTTLVKLLAGVGVAALYWWEIDQRGLLPAGVPPNLLPGLAVGMHAQWVCHTVFVWLMLVASLIDADEKLIPDEITVPGTLFGLLAAAIYPMAMLPVVWPLANGRATVGFLHVVSPHPWPDWLNGYPHGGALAIALFLWWLWCVALMDRPWCPSWGGRRALQLLCSRLVRSPSTWRLCGLGLAGTAAIVGVWFWRNSNWVGLLTGLVGMAAGGGLIWMVRIIGTVTLKREAMGFGDVTLMAMIGSLLGWQSCLVIFFLAPLAGLVLGLLQLILHRQNEIPYGPFLCLAAVVLIAGWCPIWAWIEPILLLLGGLVPLFMIICLGAMALLLGLWRLIRESFR